MAGLGYERYGAGGGDFGAGVATYMALDNPAPMIGIHLSNLEIEPRIGPEHPPLTDALLTTVTLYWVTETITTSMRDYVDNRWYQDPLGPKDFIEVPTGVAAFPNMFVPEGDAPREWVARLYNVRSWTRMPTGGHFAPAEQPEALARDIAKFFGSAM